MDLDDDPTLELAGRIRSVVAPLSRALRHQLGGRLTATQHSVLGSIVRHGPLRLSELAEREQLSAPMITKVVDVLCSEGLVERIEDPDDGRARQIRVSASGATWLEASRERRDRWLADRLARLNPAEREALTEAIPLLERLL